MQDTALLTPSAQFTTVQDTWNQARSLEQLRSFVASKIDSNEEEILA